LPDRQLSCAPIDSKEGKSYLSAMAAAANFAWANRQCITHWTRESFCQIFRKSLFDVGLFQVYDVAHNIAKIETHLVEGKNIDVCVHRKGATRAFPKDHKKIPRKYKDIGQPVIIPGDMGRYSYVAIGSETAMKETFGSTCHGAGRVLSRSAAKKQISGQQVVDTLQKKGIIIRSGNIRNLSEEASIAYKDVADVIDVVHEAGISKKILKLTPIGVIKG
jgi:tRNA-splicing ligase RtcB